MRFATGRVEGGNGVTGRRAPREKAFLLARREVRILEWLALRVPARIMPDHMTTLGVLAAFGIAAAYLLSNGDRAWLWAASALLVVPWLGDSLDGTLARVRRAERPTQAGLAVRAARNLRTLALREPARPYAAP